MLLLLCPSQERPVVRDAIFVATSKRLQLTPTYIYIVFKGEIIFRLFEVLASTFYNEMENEPPALYPCY